MENCMNHNENSLNTEAVDLFTPANRFSSASVIYGRLHRWWLVLRKYWRLPTLILLAVLGPIYLYTALSGPRYESKARMWLTGKINLSGYPVSTRKFLEFRMQAYLDYKKAALDQASGQAAVSRTAEGAQLKSELELAQAKLHAFQESNNVVFLQQQGAGAENYLATLNRQLAIL